MRDPLPPGFAVRLSEDDEVGVVLSCVNLLQDSADAWNVITDHNEEVLRDKPFRRQFVDYLDVCQSLLVGADFVHALHDVDSIWTKHSLRFIGSGEV